MLLFIFTPMVCSFAFTYGLSYIKSHRTNQQNIREGMPLSPENTMVIFDLHGVVFSHQYSQMILTFLRSPLKWRLLRALFNPCLLWDIVKLLYRRPVPESFFMHLAHDYKDIHDILPLLISIANLQTPNEGTIQIIKDLKRQGYTLAVLSNIGQRIFNDLEPQHHDLFHMFDYIIVSTPETRYISKPNPKIYERFLNETDRNKTMILIDDKEKNVCGGLKFGIIGITFKGAKQLKERLMQLNVKL